MEIIILDEPVAVADLHRLVSDGFGDMVQHAGLGAERWGSFTLDQQILMIANEMHRTSKLLGTEDELRRRNGYERTLALADLTVRTSSAPTLRRELLRWRGLVAALYVAPHGSAEEHAEALRMLLRFTPAASRQIPLLLARLGGSA